MLINATNKYNIIFKSNLMLPKYNKKPGDNKYKKVNHGMLNLKK